jgi:hypothetical protein
MGPSKILLVGGLKGMAPWVAARLRGTVDTACDESRALWGTAFVISSPRGLVGEEALG